MAFDFKRIMLVILPLTAFYILRGRSFDDNREELPPGKTILLAVIIALVIGIYDGFYGPAPARFLFCC